MEGWIAMADVPEEVQRWTAKRRVALALRHRPRETSVEAARSGAAGVSEVVANNQRVAAHPLIVRM
jgi:hypothetical protein